jgi:hypothetical protein
MIVLGGLSYFLLFYQQFADHDYYMINMLTVILFPVVTAFIALKNRFPRYLNSYPATLVLFVLAFLGLQYAGLNLHRRYDPQQTAASPINPGFYSIRPLLDSAGIGPAAKIISIPDDSPNISLYFIDRRGWTVPEKVQNMADTVWLLSRKGAEYLLISEPAINKRQDMQIFYTNKILDYKGIAVYKL